MKSLSDHIVVAVCLCVLVVAAAVVVIVAGADALAPTSFRDAILVLVGGLAGVSIAGRSPGPPPGG